MRNGFLSTLGKFCSQLLCPHPFTGFRGAAAYLWAMDTPARGAMIRFRHQPPDLRVVLAGPKTGANEDNRTCIVEAHHDSDSTVHEGAGVPERQDENCNGQRCA